MPSIVDILLVGSGGAVGSISRYCIDSLKPFQNASFNTISINLTGCLLIGILWAFFNRSGQLDSSIYKLFVTGLLGGYTTFSTFALQPINMLRSGNLPEALGYIAISVIGGLLFCWIGISVTQKILEAS